MYLNRFQSFVCTVIFCTVCTSAISLDSTPKPPLSVSNPISGDAGGNKELRREESRYNNEPVPEFYKGPSRDRDRYGFQTSNDAVEHRYDATSSTNAIPYGSSGYGGSRPWSSSGYGSSRDRISVGGVGSGYYGSSGLGSTGYGGYDRQRPYGPPQTVDLPGGGGYYSSDYGHGNSYGSGYGQGHDMWTEKWQHLSKSNLVPIASAALLGIAAAFLFNPVLLQLGTISGRRRRRETSEQSDESNESDYSHDLAYKGQKYQ